MLRPKRQSSNTVTVTAPIGGWNAVNQLAAMSPNDAVVIDNWFCLPTELQSRKGYVPWATITSGNIESFINYNSPSGTIKIFACTDAGAIWNVSSGVTPATVATGLANGRWMSASVANSGGSFTLAVNRADYPKLYDGTTWYNLTNSSTPYAITGVDPRLFKDVIVHHHRVWFIEKNSMKCWYMGIDAIAGAAVKYDFAPLFERGGSIAKIATWTLDAGQGMDDYFVVITTEGEIAVFSGTDPSSASTWSLNGVYYCGSPVGSLSTIKYGGDVLLLNKDGLVPMSQWLMSSRINVKTTITNKIQQRITDATTQYENNYGWQIVINPPNNMLFINVPISSTESHQYVMNTVSGAWSRFTGVNAKCWNFIDDKLLFANGSNVFEFWVGENDNGAIITTDLLPAFQSFGRQSQIKRFTMARVFMGHDGAFSFSCKLNTDFDLTSQPPQPYTSLSSGNAGVWDVSTWDNAIWAGEIMQFNRWQFAGGIGHYGAFRIKTASMNSTIRYYATDYVYESGGVL